MYWTDLAFDRAVPDERVRKAWATVFGVAPEDVSVVVDFAGENPWADPRTRIVLERLKRQGEYPLQVMVILGGADLEARVATLEGELATVRQLCAELDCRALISTEGIEPWELLLVTPAGETTIVEVDDDELEETGAFVLLRESTTTLSR